jgi:segregation and condensation protein B
LAFSETEDSQLKTDNPFMSLKPQLEAIIYAAEIPITLDQIIPLVKDSVLSESSDIDAAEIRSRVRAAIEELTADYSGPTHGIEIRQIAGGYRMSTKPEQHDVVRAFAKSLKSPSRLSMPALETLAVIAYKQPVTVPEISEIRGVDSGGVIATLLDRKLITTAGRKAVISPAWRNSKSSWPSPSRAICCRLKVRLRRAQTQKSRQAPTMKTAQTAM